MNFFVGSMSSVMSIRFISIMSILLIVKNDKLKIISEFKGKTPFVGFIRVRWPHLLILEPEVIKDVLIRNFNSFCNTEIR